MNCEVLRRLKIPSTEEDGLHQPLISHPETKVLLPLYLVIYFIHSLLLTTERKLLNNVSKKITCTFHHLCIFLFLYCTVATLLIFCMFNVSMTHDEKM